MHGCKLAHYRLFGAGPVRVAMIADRGWLIVEPRKASIGEPSIREGFKAGGTTGVADANIDADRGRTRCGNTEQRPDSAGPTLGRLWARGALCCRGVEALAGIARELHHVLHPPRMTTAVGRDLVSTLGECRGARLDHRRCDSVPNGAAISV